MKTVKIFLIVLLGAVTAAVAQPQKGHPHKKEGKACRQETKAYMEAEVMPTVKAWRKAFDVSLSTSEKNTINEVRASLEAHRKGMKGLRKEMRALHQSGQEPSEAQQTKMKQAHEQKKALMEQLKPIVENHQDELKALKENNSEQMKTWHEALAEIKKKHFGERPEGERPERMHPRGEGMPEEGHHKGMHGKHKRGHKGMGVHVLAPHRFLLLDPDKDMDDWDDEMDSEGIDSYKSSVFPNPAVSQQTLAFKTSKAGIVKVELLDNKGNVVKTLSNQKTDAGAHSFQINTDELPKNIYFYRITTPDGVETKRMVKQ